ncbi:uncharacterized protein [Lepeophtheirus salmonis]|uniref:F-box domain-containing protein n=1 Tax=Lepeophtheirus salmonis TaxID=72036 RepID=A0A0K2UIU7_LEPSM|nr:uncharacterized protein LOC121129721 [Lepeophtheirus salmonis]XP_040581375.1 uncharacterized protein LOC121129721 [Lepeophtheirus salmonis]
MYMQDFFITENHLVLRRIFLSLDAYSLRASKLVHSSWYLFIRDYIYKSPSCRKELSLILEYQWIKAKPELSSFTSPKPIFHLDADTSNVICGMDSGQIEIRNAHSLMLEKTLGSRNHNCYTRVSMNSQYVASGFFNCTLSLWKRNDDYKLADEIQMRHSIFGIKITEGCNIVISMVDGNVETYTVSEESKLIQKWIFNSSSPRLLNNFDCDDERVFCGTSNGIVNVWDLSNGNNVFSKSISDKILQTFVAGKRGIALLKGGMSASRVQVWNLENGEILKDFSTERIRSCSLYANRFVILTPERFSVLNVNDLSRGFQENPCYPYQLRKNSWTCCKVLKDRLIIFGSDTHICILNFWKGSEVYSSESSKEGGHDNSPLKFVKKLYIC